MGIFRRKSRMDLAEGQQPAELPAPDLIPDATAQEAFSAMMKDSVAPALRQLGFRGSGQVFSLPSQTHFAQIGFQKSTYSTSDRVRVTANVSVIPIEVWEQARADSPNLPLKPAPSVFYGSFAWQRRIGDLLPSGADTWWVIDGGCDPSPVATEIIESVRRYALPAMKAQLGDA